MSETEIDDDGIEPRQTEKTIEVDPPIKIKASTYTELHLREPKGFEVQQAEALIGTGATIAGLRRYQFSMISKVSGWPLAALEQLPITVIDEAGRFVLGFTSLGPPTGDS